MFSNVAIKTIKKTYDKNLVYMNHFYNRVVYISTKITPSEKINCYLKPSLPFQKINCYLKPSLLDFYMDSLRDNNMK